MAEDAVALAQTGKRLTFRLGSEQYGLDILKVQEIIGIMPITRVPRTPAAVRGVINLRGRVIPVVDLRIKFGAPSTADNDRTCIVVVQVEGKTGPNVMGVVVDEVSEVIDIAADAVDETPKFGSDVNTDFVLGIAKVADSVVMLLDIDRVLSSNETQAVKRIAKKA